MYILQVEYRAYTYREGYFDEVEILSAEKEEDIPKVVSDFISKQGSRDWNGYYQRAFLKNVTIINKTIDKEISTS